MQNNTSFDWTRFAGLAPWATIFALLFTLAQGVVHIVDVDKLSFDDYLTQVAALWSFIAVGRGFAVKADDIDINPMTRFLNSFPWATVVVGIVAVVGYIDVTLVDDTSLTYGTLGTKLAVLIGALGLGRGVAALKKDTTFNSVAYNVGGDPSDIETHPDAGDLPEITDENVGKLSAQAGVADVGLANSGDAHGEDTDLGADVEPGPAKAPPLGEGPTEEGRGV